jgi:hypothetical protein
VNHEYIRLRDEPPPLVRCPKCGVEPFEPFLRGLVYSEWRAFLGLFSWLWGKRYPVSCVICRACKDIVGYE